MSQDQPCPINTLPYIAIWTLIIPNIVANGYLDVLQLLYRHRIQINWHAIELRNSAINHPHVLEWLNLIA